METKNNKGLIILIFVLVLLVIGFGGYFVYDQFIADNNTKEVDKNNNNNNDKNNSNTDTDSNTNNGNNSKDSTNNDTTNNNQIDYTGTYLSVDGDPNNAYIELYSNNTYKRNVNFCSEIVIFEGTYSVSIENGITIIKFISETSEYGYTVDSLVSFVYEDGKLSVIDDTNTYAYYDCTNTRTFQKK